MCISYLLRSTTKFVEIHTSNEHSIIVFFSLFFFSWYATLRSELSRIITIYYYKDYWVIDSESYLINNVEKQYALSITSPLLT